MGCAQVEVAEPEPKGSAELLGDEAAAAAAAAAVQSQRSAAAAAAARLFVSGIQATACCSERSATCLFASKDIAVPYTVVLAAANPEEAAAKWAAAAKRAAENGFTRSQIRTSTAVLYGPSKAAADPSVAVQFAH